ncbi:PREDICTED: protein FAM24B [Myotis davidii]|uniref:protein FAM24B n=1 Tax=Myotis davidii TaxID=225400 RepID=UPI000766E2A7|nr:PREDICTED: protein FAM24B [Myotis davidii]
MCCSWKFVLIVCFLSCWLPSCSGDLDSKTSEVLSVAMISIGAGILLALLALLGVISCLYFKVAKALKVSKPPFCLALKNHPSVVTQDKITAAPSITTGCYPNLQFCEECPLFTDFDCLPPCFCDVNEGL